MQIQQWTACSVTITPSAEAKHISSPRTINPPAIALTTSWSCQGLAGPTAGATFAACCCDSAALLPLLGKQAHLPKQQGNLPNQLTPWLDVTPEEESRTVPFHHNLTIAVATLQAVHSICQEHHGPGCISPFSSLCILQESSNLAEGPYEELFISSLPSLQTGFPQRNREAPVPARQC